MTGPAPWLVALLFAVVLLAVAGVAWAALRREKARLGFLHAAALALLEARDPETASVDLLRRASRRFHASCAELTLIPDTGTPAAFRTTLRDSKAVDVMRPVDDDEDGGARPAPPSSA